jgi:hypothetical protein
MQQKNARREGRARAVAKLKPPYYKTWSIVSLGLKEMLSLSLS